MFPNRLSLVSSLPVRRVKIYLGTRQRGRPTFPSPGIDRSINISLAAKFSPLGSVHRARATRHD